MALFNLNPTVNQTPDSGQSGGAVAVNSPTNTGHSDTTVFGFNNGQQIATCRWFGFQSTSQIISIRLKFDWSESGFINTPGEAFNSFGAEYSLNGGTSWNTAFSHAGITSASSGSVDINIPVQDVSQIQVRDQLNAFAITFGGDSGVTGSISNIRLEVTVVDGTVIVLM